MPKRKSVKKHDTSEVQGEGSYVILSSVKVWEIRKLRQESANPDVNQVEAGIVLLARHVVGWNWVDDEGQPLPVPKDDPTVVDELTEEESEFLANLLVGKPKNSESG